MENGKKRIDEIIKISDELDVLLQEESDNLKKAMDNNKNIILINRENKKVKATEKELWEEIRILGAKCQAGEIMAKKYPELFKIVEKREKKNTELHNFVAKEFNFDFQQMTIGNYLKLTRAVVAYMLGGSK